MTREHEHSFDLFGTRVRLLIAGPADAPFDVPVAALRVQARLTPLHHALTRFDPASELSRFNARSSDTMAISRALQKAIAAAPHAAHISGGLVDPTILPSLECAGYTTSRAGLEGADLMAAIAAASPRRGAEPDPAAAWGQINLDPDAEPLATTTLLPGPDRGHELLAQHGGALILDDGELILAGNLEPALTSDAVLAR